MYKSRTPGHYDQYQTAKFTLQKQTAALLPERNQLQNRYPINQPQRQKNRQLFSQFASISPAFLEKKIDGSKAQEVVNKLQQIIRLCKQEGNLSNQEMREVIKVQNQVLNYLQKANTEDEPKIINPHYQQASTYSPNQKYTQNQYQYQYPDYQQESHLRSLQSQAQKNIIQQKNEPQFKIGSTQIINSKRDVNQGGQVLIPQTWRKQQRNNVLSQDTIQIIAQIQRKALTEIIHLQQERDNFKKQRDSLLIQLQKVKGQAASNQQSIMQRVSQQQQKISWTKGIEIERLASENHLLKSSALQSENIRKENKLLRDQNQVLIQRIEHLESGFRQMRKTDLRQTYPEYQQPRLGLAYGQYDSQFSVYENELRKANAAINEMRSKLLNIPGFQELHAQGEIIRRETAQLLQMRARLNAPSHESGLIRQLQQRLQEQERGKALFLQQLKVFKQKYNELEQQNRVLKKSKVSFDPVPRIATSTNQRETSPGRGIMKKKNNYFSDYETTLNEMKRVLY